MDAGILSGIQTSCSVCHQRRRGDIYKMQCSLLVSGRQGMGDLMPDSPPATVDSRISEIDAVPLVGHLVSFSGVFLDWDTDFV